MYRCQRPDGSILYTDSQATCPGASLHEPREDVQNVVTTPSPASQTTAHRIEKIRHQLEADATVAEEWKQKKTNAEQELAEVTAEQGSIKRFLTFCNRGGKLFVTKDNGLRKSVSCKSVKEEVAALESRHAELSAYLNGGLQQECHRAGCLPGWVR